MHEVEIGTWKALFIHLLRILEAIDENLLHELDRRWVSCYYYFSSDASWDWQLSIIANVREGYHPAVLVQYFRIEENGGQKL